MFHVIFNTYQYFLNKILTKTVRNKNSRIHTVLNLHVWPLSCEFTLNNLRRHPLFPINPYKQRLVNSLEISLGKENIHAQYYDYRLFGFLQVRVLLDITYFLCRPTAILNFG